MQATLAANILLTSIPVLVNLYMDRDREEDRGRAFPKNPKNYNLPVEEFFDFIVVGGGTAGCVVARRLSDENYTVLLLEAGGTPPPLQAVPMASAFTIDLPELNFRHFSIPQKNSGLSQNGIINPTNGKMLGGCSSHNGMVYERGHPHSYEVWANLTGNDGWRYKNVLKYYKKAEKYMGPFKSTGDQHGHHGPMTVSKSYDYPLKLVWLKAGKELGYKIRDSNGPQKIGFSPIVYNTEFGRRVSTYTAYIEGVEAEDRKKNLVIRRYAWVSKIIFKKKIAHGVIYTHHGVPRVARATKEIIVCTGSYMSPVLLMRSGIGPAKQLKMAKVKPISILPVGEFLYDHPLIPVTPIFIQESSLVWEIQRNLSFGDFKTFLNKGTGPVSTFFRNSGGEAFFASTRAVEKEKWPGFPDLQIYFSRIFREKLTQKPSTGCTVSMDRPYSVGRVTLNVSAIDPTNESRTDPNQLPIIDYNYFSVDSDFDVAIEGIKFCLNVIENTKAFKKIGAYFTTRPIRSCRHHPFRSDDYWRCYIRQKSNSGGHPTGTCRMGRKDDPRSVVDGELRVIGVKRLRIADVSIIPWTTNANTAAPAVMIGEKAASDIIRFYRKIYERRVKKVTKLVEEQNLGNLTHTEIAENGGNNNMQDGVN